MLRWLFVSVALLWSISGWAQQSEPQASASSYLTAMSKYDTRAMVAGMHPEALTQFRSIIFPIFQGSSSARASAELLPVFGVKTISELEHLSPEAFYATFLVGLGKVNPQFADMMRASRYEVLGHVLEKGDAHVVYRLTLTVEGNKISRVAVISLKKNAGSWGALLTTEAEGVATSLRRQYQ